MASLAIGAAAFLLTQAIPFIGPLLAPLVAIITTFYAFGTISTFEESTELAKQFFKLLVEIFNAVAERWALGARA
jgi:CHASE2 domain-containing sensor protein